MSLETRALVDGRWVEAPEGRTFPVNDPATGDEIAQVTESDPGLAARAVDAAAHAMTDWRRLPAKARSAVLRRWHDATLDSQESLAVLISREMGKPLAEARGEVAYGASYLEWFAEEAKRNDGEVLASPVPGRRLLTVREPVGVVAAVTPWNFPLAMLARKLAPALAAGCGTVAKPAEDTPLTALAFAALAGEAGLPAGLINILPVSRDGAAALTRVWLDDTRVRKISFTGSTPVGKHLARASADTLKRISLELGGDAAFIVFDDADLDVAIQALMAAKFRNAGQACIAANRVLVQAGVYDAFAARLTRAVATLKVGPALAGPSDIGPLINGRARDKVARLVDQARSQGAELLAGGAALEGPGWFYAPTLLGEVTDAMACFREEIFGPVVALSCFATEDEAIARANATPFGLAAYACTRDAARIWRLTDRLEVGMLGINEGAISTEVAPFGGVKESGYGREGSRHGLGDYQSIKYVCLGGV